MRRGHFPVPLLYPTISREIIAQPGPGDVPRRELDGSILLRPRARQDRDYYRDLIDERRGVC